MAITVLMVAEKPKLADVIARLLSDNKASKRKGLNQVCSVSEFYGEFEGQAARFKVTSTLGHIMTLDFPAEFNNWARTQPVELYSAPTEKLEADPKMRMNYYLSCEARGADYLVLWLDCDPEGENICFEVIEAVVPVMKKPHHQDITRNIYRAHFSAVTETEIKAAMRNLRRPNQNASLAVEARRELDLRVGCSFTRFQTRYFKHKYGDIGKCVSYGPCQTPTLSFCVTRHDEIMQFQPQAYWVIQTVFGGRDGLEMSATCSRGQINDREIATQVRDKIKRCGMATVVDISSRVATKERPKALNTVELLRTASSLLDLSPAHAMSVAENLYMQGYISYPRTETTSYPASFDLRGTLVRQARDPVYGALVSQLLDQGFWPPRVGVDKGDHPPITPMRAAEGRLGGDEARLYDYVTRHFIATLMRPCTYENTSARLDAAGEEFTLQGRILTDPGYTEILPWQALGSQERLPPVQQGDSLSLKSIKMAAKKTSPPSYLTESELITLMERHGIGTDASIPVHINMICKRNYVAVKTGRRLVPTTLGISLIHGYRAVDEELVLPTMRANVEHQLNRIASGEADYNTVKNTIIDMFRQKFLIFVENVAKVDSIFAETCEQGLIHPGQSDHRPSTGHSSSSVRGRGVRIRVATRTIRGSSRGSRWGRGTRGGVRGAARGARAGSTIYSPPQRGPRMPPPAARPDYSMDLPRVPPAEPSSLHPRIRPPNESWVPLPRHQPLNSSPPPSLPPRPLPMNGMLPPPAPPRPGIFVPPAILHQAPPLPPSALPSQSSSHRNSFWGNSGSSGNKLPPSAAEF